MKDVNVYLYKMIIKTGLILPTYKVIKFTAAAEIDEERDWIIDELNGNIFLGVVDYKNKLHCLSRAEIKSITIKKIKKV